MKNYFKSTAVVLAVVTFLVQACGDNNKNSTAVAAAGPRGGVDTTGFVESKAIAPTDSKISFTILSDNIDVAIDGDQKFVATPDKAADGSDAGTTTVVSNVNLLVKNIKVPISLTHTFMTKLTDLAIKARDAGNNANAKVAARDALQKKADDAKAANDPNLASINTALEAAKAAADEAVKAAVAATDLASKDADTKALLDKNLSAQRILTKLNPINGLDYNIEVIGYIPNELSSMYYITVRMAAVNKDQVKNSARAFALAFGVPAGQTTKVTKIILEDANTLSTSTAAAEKTLNGILANTFAPGLITTANSSADQSTAAPAKDASATSAPNPAPAPAPAKDSTAAASSVPAAKTGK